MKLFQKFKQIFNKKTDNFEKFLAVIPEPLFSLGVGNIVYFNTNLKNDDNAMPDKLEQLYYKGSPINQRIINTKSNMLYGEGLQHPDPKVMEWIEEKQINKKLRQICKQMALFEQAYILTIPNKGNDKIIDIKVFNAKNCRFKVDDMGDIIDVVWKKDWLIGGYFGGIFGSREQNTKELPIFNRKKASEIPMCYVIGDNWENDYYQIPSYYSCLNYVYIDQMISQYHAHSVETSFIPPVAINVPNARNWSEEKKIDFYNQLAETYFGPESSKLFATFGDEERVEINQLVNNNNIDIYDNLSKLVESKIATAHGFTQELAGIETQQNKLSGDSGGKLRIARELALRDVIEPVQCQIIEFFNTIARINEWEEAFEIINTTPIFLQDTSLLLSILTQDELRELIGYEQMKEGDQSADAEVEEEIGDNQLEDEIEKKEDNI
jgi:hypothetical protein